MSLTYVGSATTLHNLLFFAHTLCMDYLTKYYAHTLCMDYLTKTFLLVCSLVRRKQESGFTRTLKVLEFENQNSRP